MVISRFAVIPPRGWFLARWRAQTDDSSAEGKRTENFLNIFLFSEKREKAASELGCVLETVVHSGCTSRSGNRCRRPRSVSCERRRNWRRPLCEGVTFLAVSAIIGGWTRTIAGPSTIWWPKNLISTRRPSARRSSVAIWKPPERLIGF